MIGMDDVGDERDVSTECK